MAHSSCEAEATALGPVFQVLQDASQVPSGNFFYSFTFPSTFRAMRYPPHGAFSVTYRCSAENAERGCCKNTADLQYMADVHELQNHILVSSGSFATAPFLCSFPPGQSGRFFHFSDSAQKRRHSPSITENRGFVCCAPDCGACEAPWLRSDGFAPWSH